MKVITLTEPWATLVVIGAKLFETRSWQRAPQGPLLVHAAKGMPGWASETVKQSGTIQKALCEYFGTGRIDVLRKLDQRRGKIIGSATHMACRRTEDIRDSLSPQELAFGDYGDGRFAWHLDEPRAHQTFIPVRGALGIWTLPADLETAVLAAAAEERV